MNKVINSKSLSVVILAYLLTKSYELAMYGGSVTQ